MSKLIISQNFTIDDIRKIREYNYERRKNMTFKEYKEDVAKGVAEGLIIIERIKNENENRLAKQA